MSREQTPDTRHWFTNDGLAIVLILSFIGYVWAPLLPYIDGYPNTNAAVLTAYITAFGVAIAWTFGKDAVQAWRSNARSK